MDDGELGLDLSRHRSFETQHVNRLVVGNREAHSTHRHDLRWCVRINRDAKLSWPVCRRACWRTRKWSGPATCQCFQGVSALTVILAPQLIACNALRSPLCLFVTLNHSCDTGTLRLKPSCTDAQHG